MPYTTSNIYILDVCYMRVCIFWKLRLVLLNLLICLLTSSCLSLILWLEIGCLKVFSDPCMTTFKMNWSHFRKCNKQPSSRISRFLGVTIWTVGCTSFHWLASVTWEGRRELGHWYSCNSYIGCCRGILNCRKLNFDAVKVELV